MRFVDLVQGPEGDIALDVACLLVATQVRADPYPDEVMAAGQARLDSIAAGCPGPTLGDLRTHLFTALGFTGNRRQYDDPRNSFLDEVLERRTGIPITLAVVVIEVGRRLGLRLDAVGMPGHFMVGTGEGAYVDAFDGGRLLDEDGCRRRFLDLTGPDAPWSPQLLAPVGPRAVISRVLANLRAIYAEAQDIERLDRVLELRLAIPGVGEGERAERASVLAALGRYDEAARQLELAATALPLPQAAPAAALRARAARLRARLN